MQTTYRTNWILNDTLGIFLSIALAAGVLTYAGQLIGDPVTPLDKLGNLGVAIVGGLFAGSILAWFQWRILKKRYDDLSWTKWWRNTVLAFIGGWILAIVPSLTYTSDHAIQQVIPPFGIPVHTVMYGSIIFGAVLGSLIGFGQYLELRKHQKRASRWIGLNVFSWAAGFFVIVLLGLLFDQHLSMFLLTGVAGGLITALCVAGVTSYFFRKTENEVNA